MPNLMAGLKTLNLSDVSKYGHECCLSINYRAAVKVEQKGIALLPLF
jgi:hypothetical protein